MRVFTCRSILISLLAIGDAASASPRKDEACRSFPGDTSWPPVESWIQFNQSLGGKLNNPSPPGAVCRRGQSAFDADKCAAVTAGWSTYGFHQGDPVSNMWQHYNNDTCLPDPDAPCSGAGYPAYVVNATTANDVKLSLDFAWKNNVRIVVKSSGHDFQGRSQAPGALSIWVHHMQSHKIHDDSFKPKGCNFTIDTPAVTVGGGSQLGPLQMELDKIGRTVVGGNSRSVSVGGYITGGGHSILSPGFGMGADHVLEMEVVTPTGDIVTANECQNDDLFWAMRGGGGSTFGVMTSVTLATHPTPKLVAGVITILSPEPSSSWTWDMVGYFVSSLSYLASKDVSGYITYPTNVNMTGADGRPLNGSFAGMAGEYMLLHTQDINDMSKIWEPIVAHVNATWPDAIVTFSMMPYPSFNAWFSVWYDQATAGYDGYVGSRLLDNEALAASSSVLGEAFKVYDGAAYLVAGKGVRDAKPRGGSTSVNPNWRKTIAHTVNHVVFQPLNATAKAEALVRVNQMTEPLRKLAPHMGAYVNENNPNEPDWQHAFWGENYKRLLRIKRAVDPDDLLWCHPCVGNENWEQADDYRLCRTDFANASEKQHPMSK
ncbi:FAD-binding domain-containing protein [Astrocystis sublimbata]|nr:FAD-binding domain-containing protein [Astrocystis sublimbata]